MTSTLKRQQTEALPPLSHATDASTPNGVTDLTPRTRQPWEFTQTELQGRFAAMLERGEARGTLLEEDGAWVWSPLMGWPDVRAGFAANPNFVLRLGFTTHAHGFVPPALVPHRQWCAFMDALIGGQACQGGAYVLGEKA